MDFYKIHTFPRGSQKSKVEGFSTLEQIYLKNWITYWIVKKI